MFLHSEPSCSQFQVNGTWFSVILSLLIIAATDFPFGNRSRNMNIRTRAVIKIIFWSYPWYDLFVYIWHILELFCLKMKTVFFESLLHKLITKNDFYYGSCPDIHTISFVAGSPFPLSQCGGVVTVTSSRPPTVKTSESKYKESRTIQYKYKYFFQM